MNIANDILGILLGSSVVGGAITTYYQYKSRRNDPAKALGDSAVALNSVSMGLIKQLQEDVTVLKNNLLQLEKENAEIKKQLQGLYDRSNSYLRDIRILITAWEQKLPNEPLPIDKTNYPV